MSVVLLEQIDMCVMNFGRSNTRVYRYADGICGFVGLSPEMYNNTYVRIVFEWYVRMYVSVCVCVLLGMCRLISIGIYLPFSVWKL